MRSNVTNRKKKYKKNKLHSVFFLWSIFCFCFLWPNNKSHTRGLPPAHCAWWSIDAYDGTIISKTGDTWQWRRVVHGEAATWDLATELWVMKHTLGKIEERKRGRDRKKASGNLEWAAKWKSRAINKILQSALKIKLRGERRWNSRK